MAVPDKVLAKSEVKIDRAGKIERIGLVVLVVGCLVGGVLITPAIAVAGPILAMIWWARLERELETAKVLVVGALTLSALRTRETSADLLEELGLAKTPEDAKRIGEMIEDPVLIVKAGRVLRDKGAFLDYDGRGNTVSTEEEN